MEKITLKVNPKYWILFFVFFFASANVILYYFAGVQSFQLLLPIAFAVSVSVVGSAVGISRFNQREVILDDNRIKKMGYRSKTISFSDIKKVEVGTGGFSIYDASKSPIKITTMHSNFDTAKEVLKEKIKGRKSVEVNFIPNPRIKCDVPCRWLPVSIYQFPWYILK
ncbi:MAG: hypothetical protein RI575_08285 [Balneolaceae bacterium]|nr:hypothetical protein [Balneolaceae bacterium]MDR9409360.1 hypothetical protein [Balneolaceae bacterium]